MSCKANSASVLFKEIYAGRPRLTEVVAGDKRFAISRPVEIKIDKACALLDNEAYQQLVADAKTPNKQLWHFGMPSSSFSILQHANRGTRRYSRPEGNGNLCRENVGNELLSRILCLIDCFESAGNYWAFENPFSSYVWFMPAVRNKIDSSEVFEAVLHQCWYGLKIRDAHGKSWPCKKQTRFVGNLPVLPQLSRQCRCSTEHLSASGGIKTTQGWKKRCDMAGYYPFALCYKYTAIASSILPL